MTNCEARFYSDSLQHVPAFLRPDRRGPSPDRAGPRHAFCIDTNLWRKILFIMAFWYKWMLVSLQRIYHFLQICSIYCYRLHWLPVSWCFIDVHQCDSTKNIPSWHSFIDNRPLTVVFSTAQRVARLRQTSGSPPASRFQDLIHLMCCSSFLYTSINVVSKWRWLNMLAQYDGVSTWRLDMRLPQYADTIWCWLNMLAQYDVGSISWLNIKVKIDGGWGFDPLEQWSTPSGKVPKWGWGVGFGQFTAK